MQVWPNSGFVSSFFFGAQPHSCICLSSVVSFPLPEHILASSPWNLRYFSHREGFADPGLYHSCFLCVVFKTVVQACQETFKMTWTWLDGACIVYPVGVLPRLFPRWTSLHHGLLQWMRTVPHRRIHVLEHLASSIWKCCSWWWILEEVGSIWRK